MAFSNSTGVYTPASGATTAAPGQTIASLTWNNIFTDLSTALTQLGEGTFAPPSTSLTCANGANNNLTLPATTRFYVTGPSAAFTITGFAGGTDGRRIYVYNPTNFTMTLVNKATSTATNQINTLTGSNIVLNASSYATLSYDGTTSFWVLESYNTGQPAIIPNGGLTDSWFTNYQTVNFAASASDIGVFAVPLPVSVSNYKIAALKIGNALGNLNSAVVSLYTGAGATGVVAVSSTATTITATVGANATQVMLNANIGTFMYNTTTHGPNLYLHVTTSTPTSNTADVVVQIEPVY